MSILKKHEEKASRKGEKAIINKRKRRGNYLV